MIHPVARDRVSLTMTPSVLTAHNDSLERIRVRLQIANKTTPEGMVQRLLMTLDVLSMSRISITADDAVGGLVQAQLSQQCFSATAKGVIPPPTLAMILKKPVSDISIFATALSHISKVAFYRRGNVGGYAQPFKEYPGQSVGMCKFDCVRPLTILREIDSEYVVFRPLAESGVIEFVPITFLKTNVVKYEPFSFVHETVSFVHCAEFKFGVCYVNGCVDILNIGEATFSLLDAQVGERFLFVQDKNTQRWIVHDMDGDDKLLRLGIYYATYGFQTSGQKMSYQFERHGIVMGYANLSIFSKVTDHNYPNVIKTDPMLMKVKQRLDANFYGFDFSDYLLNFDEVAKINLIEMIANCEMKDIEILTDMANEVRSICTTALIIENKNSATKKNRDVDVPVCQRLVNQVLEINSYSETHDHVVCPGDFVRTGSICCVSVNELTKFHADTVFDLVMEITSCDTISEVIIGDLVQITGVDVCRRAQSLSHFELMTQDSYSNVILSIREKDLCIKGFERVLGDNGLTAMTMTVVVYCSRKWCDVHYLDFLNTFYRSHYRVLTSLCGKTYSSYFSIVSAYYDG